MLKISDCICNSAVLLHLDVNSLSFHILRSCNSISDRLHDMPADVPMLPTELLICRVSAFYLAIMCWGNKHAHGSSVV